MKIAYIFMNYPVPSEAFARVEVKAMSKISQVVPICLNKQRKDNGIDDECKYINVRDMFIILTCLRFYLFFFSFFKFSFNVAESKKEFLFLIALYPRLFFTAKFIDQQKFDIVHCFWGHYPSAVFWFLDKFNSKAKYSSFTGAYDLVGNTGIMKWGINHANVVSTHAKYNINDIRKFFEGKVNVFYRGINTSINLSSDKSSDCIDICYSGRMIKSKKPDLILDIVEYLIYMRGLKVKLHLFGKGPMLPFLEQKIVESNLSEYVVLHGHIKQEDMFKIISGSHFMLFPSSHVSERLPNAVKEAMNLGVIPIVDYTPGIDELVIHNVNGFIVNGFNVESVSEMICKGFNELMSDKAVKYVSSNFDVNVISKVRISEFSKVIN